MGGFNQLGYALSPEQRSLLESSNFKLSPLSTVGHVSLWRAFVMALLPITVYVFSALILLPVEFRYAHEQLVTLIHAVGAAVLIIYPTLALGVLFFGVVATQLHSRVRWSAVVFWLWWPFFKLALCVVALLLGTLLGNHLWYHQFLPHTQLTRLQAYSGIDPATATGVRLQDAGVVSFKEAASVDRSRIGCLKNGVTYCVAPIFSGEMGPKAEHDLFMAGVDCCSCPGEFRCGDWNEPSSLGGLRIADSHDRQFYRLAAEDWSATYGKTAKHPVFFQWVAEPLTAYRELWDRGCRLLVLGLLMGVLAFVLAVVVLNGLLGLLVDAGYVRQLEMPVPPGGLGQKLGERFRPHMMHGDNAPEEPAQPSAPTYVCL